MGKIKNGIIGGVSGRIGNVIGSRSNGSDYIKIIPANYHDAKTEKQLSQRNIFTAVHHLAHILVSPYLKNIWQRATNQLSAHNAFCQSNIDAFNSKGEIEDYSKLLLTKGTLSLPIDYSIKYDSNRKNHILFSWDDNCILTNSKDKHIKDDFVNIIVVKRTKEFRIHKIYDEYAKRSEEHCSMDLSAYKNGTILDIYFYFSDRDNTSFSNSIHKEVIIDNTLMNN